MAALDALHHAMRPAAGDPEGAIVLMHGRGTSEQDLFGLLEVFDAERRLAGACPRAPLQLPPMGFHWYDVARVGFPDPVTFRATYATLGGWLDGFAEHAGVQPERTLIGGFSQGAVMAWALAVGRDRPRPAGILSMSGFFPTVPGWRPDEERLAGLPVAIVHGSEDPLVPVASAREARDRAEAGGAEVLYRETPVPHILDPRIVPDLTAWVQARFERA